MLKSVLNFLAGAIVAASVSAALAVTGIAPQPGYQTPDGTWLLGIVQGQNFAYQSGITAHAGGGQTTCQNITPLISLSQVDTVASGNDSVCLPFAIAGEKISIRNNGAQTLAVYAQPNNNLLTAAGDTINNASNSSSYTVIAQNSLECFAAKNGSWSCVQGH